MLTIALLLLPALGGPTVLQDENVDPNLLIEPAHRPGRARLELALLGPPWPDATARAVRYSGSGERDKAALDLFLEERQSLWTQRAREFGLEITIEGPEQYFAEVLEAVTPGILEPNLTPEALGLTAMERLMARAPGQADPLRRFERQLTSLLDVDRAPPSILAIDLGAFFGGDDDGRDGGPPEIPGLEPLDPSALLSEWSLLGGGGVALRLSTDSSEEHRETVADLLDRVRSARSTFVNEQGPPMLFTELGYAADEATPGALVGWIAALEGSRGRSTALMDAAWRRVVTGQVNGALDEHLLSGTDLITRVVPTDRGTPSVRVIALVDPDAAIDARQSLSRALAGVADELEFGTEDGLPLRPSPLDALVDAATTRPGDPSVSIRLVPGSIRTLVCASEAILDGNVEWRLDRTGLEQSDPEVQEMLKALLEALGGREPWTEATTVRLTTSVDVGGGATIDVEQWRDLDDDRLWIRQMTDPTVVTTLADGRARQVIGSDAETESGPAMAAALTRAHRGSLLVVLQDLAGDGRLRVQRGSADELVLIDPVGGERARLWLGTDGLPARLATSNSEYGYADWTEVDGRRVPTRVDRLGDRPVTYRWSAVEWNAPAPQGLAEER
ncbi:MAG: hypothetical protein ACYTFV_01470 [Planctomycetota bacterium]|jgi:hypothetical protein